MKQADLVMLTINQYSVIGQIIDFTPKRVRVAVRQGNGYIAVLRAKHNLKMAKKVKTLA